MPQRMPTTATHLLVERACLQKVCVDDEGTVFLTTHDNIHHEDDDPPIILHVSQRRRGTYPNARELQRLSPDSGTQLDSLRGGLCINPLDRGQLVVADDHSLWTLDTVTGAVRWLVGLPDGLTRSVSSLESCGGPWVLIQEHCALDGRRLWRLDMRSLELAPVVPTLQQQGQADVQQGQVDVQQRQAQGVQISTLLCVDPSGAATCQNWRRPQLWRVQPDGATTLLAGTEEAGYRDGPAAEVQFGKSLLIAAAAGDGSIVVADNRNRRLRLVAPDGTVSTLAGSGKEGAEDGTEDGPLAEASFGWIPDLAVSADGDVLAMEERVASPESCYRFTGVVVRTVPARLPPPPHLAAQPAAPHHAAALNGGLLQSGLLADAAIRVAVGPGGQLQRPPLCTQARQQVGGDAAARQAGLAGDSAGGAGAAEGGTSGEGTAVASAAADAAAAAAPAAAAAFEDVPCHRAILAAASPFFKALFAGPLAQQQASGALAGGGSAGRKRKADDGGALTADVEQPPVATVKDASADAVRAVLRHVYTGDLAGVTPATAQDVLYLAQQWGLDGLLEACQAYVAERLLGPGNAAEWLVCAEGRQYGTVRAAALRAVVEHYKAVRADTAQAALLEAHPKLLMEAMDALVDARAVE